MLTYDAIPYMHGNVWTLTNINGITTPSTKAVICIYSYGFAFSPLLWAVTAPNSNGD